MQITVDQLKGKSLFIGLPAYGGMVTGVTTKSLIDLQVLAGQLGVQLRTFFIFNESLITRARNYIVDEFRRATWVDAEGNTVPYTHMMFIDSDIQFNPKDVLALLALANDERRILAGPYNKKTIAWEQVFKAIQLGLVPEDNPAMAANYVGDFVFNPDRSNGPQIKMNEPVKVLEAGTGFLLMERTVFDDWAEAYPQFYYKPDHNRSEHFDGSRYIHAFFDTCVHSKDYLQAMGVEIPYKVGDQEIWTDRYLSEDYFFCQTARAIGIDIWMCPWMHLVHFGSYPFQGQLPALAAIQAAQMKAGETELIGLSKKPKAQAQKTAPFPLSTGKKKKKK